MNILPDPDILSSRETLKALVHKPLAVMAVEGAQVEGEFPGIILADGVHLPLNDVFGAPDSLFQRMSSN